MAPPKSSQLQRENILAGHAPLVIVLANTLRAIITAAIPEAREVAYRGWHAMGYRHPEAGYFCGIFPHDDSIKLYFEYGRFLPDPDGILAGEGRQTRYVLIRAPGDVNEPAFKQLLEASIDLRRRFLPRTKTRTIR